MTAEEKLRLDAISRDFIKLIVHPVPFDSSKYLCVHGIGILQKEFYELINGDARARKVLGDNPYRLAYDFAMVQTAWLIKQLGTGNHIAFVCDEHEQYSSLAAAAYQCFKGVNTRAAEYMATFSYSDEKDCEPLQAADAAVYEVRRALNRSLGYRVENLRSQFKQLADESIVAAIFHATKEQLAYIAENHSPGEPFNLDVLMQRQLDEDITF